ncbi:MAG: dockerin type I repeat-containing protein [Ruminococcus sp.]|nr:dockerin type I repeat-containing protein [Ruminococcus sp.]
MKKLLTKLTAVTSVCVLALCGTVSPVSADGTIEVSEITISFDCSSDGVQLKDEYTELVQPVKVAPKSSIIIPEAFPTRDGYYFTGWTYDGVHAYTYGDTFRSPNGKDITLKPIWTAKGDENEYTLNYFVEINGETVDTEEILPDKTYHAGQIVEVSLENFMRDDAAQFGWTFDEYEFKGQEKFIMPEHDVTLTPNWKIRYKITYTVGDVDRVTGATFMEYIQPETIDTGLQNDKRFSRNGFKIVGWLCDDDNKVYAPSTPTYIMPSHDVTFTAVWEAKEYTVVFKQDKNSKNNIRIKGLTDTTVITPAATITQDGQYLSGWKDDDTGEVYPVGSEYMIMGAIEGKGITLTAVWEEGTPPETTTTTTQSSETTTTQTTTTTVTSEPIQTTTTDTICPEIIWGDANDDGKVSIADAVLIMQALSNPDDYKLTETGAINADVAYHGDGVTTADALVIQKIDIGLAYIKDLPLDAE